MSNSQQIKLRKNSEISQYQLQSYHWVQRQKSDDLQLRKLPSQSTDIFKKSPGFTYLQNTVPITLLVDPSQNTSKKKELQIINKLKRFKKKNPLDYRKNICGYITKKIIREFTNTQYMEKVQQLCAQFRCDYNDAKLYYASKIEHVTGPSHIPGLLIPEDDSQRRFKLAFREFFQWFLRQQYLRYLLIQGKMSNKKAYIQYKNTTLLSLIAHKNIEFPIKMEPEDSQRSYQNEFQNEKQENQKQNNQQFLCIPKQVSNPSSFHILIPMPVHHRNIHNNNMQNSNLKTNLILVGQSAGRQLTICKKIDLMKKDMNFSDK